MYTIFWVTAGGLYYKVNPIIGSRREDDYYYEYYQVADDSSPSFYINPTEFEVLASDGALLARKPNVPRKKRALNQCNF